MTGRPASCAGSASWIQAIAFRVLGPVDVVVGDRVIEIGSPKQRALLAALLLRVGTVVPVGVLVEDLWGESPPPAVVATIQSLASRLRRVLADGACLRSRSGGYVLEAPPAALDAVRFDRLATQGRQALAVGDAHAAADALAAALTLWRGAAFGDLADQPFARDEAQRLEEARLGAVEDLADALLALDRPQDALDRLETHIAQHPLRERPWAQTMLALYRVGRQADALHTFRRLRRLLAEELGVEPVPPLRRLAERILHQDADLLPGVAAARVAEHRRDNLPVALTSLVGRKRELEEVVAALTSARLLTLAGPGGSGKTRLALQAAASVLDSFADGVWFVDLAPVRDPGLVLDEVVTAVGLLPEALGRGEAPRLLLGLCGHLRTRRLLLVLDNCEHVVEAVARIVQAVLGRCPAVAVLATSREVLGVPGEVFWRVPPLSLPPAGTFDVAELLESDAAALLCERAREVQPGFELNAANAAAVVRICRRLDGLPLGLELAAAKIRVLGASQVAERLDDRLGLLAGGSRVADQRHRTLRAAMDWSHGLLPVPEQVLLRRLSVFRGTFTLAAVEDMIGQDVEVLGPLTRLVDKSMVAVVDHDLEVRYGLLETVREYAGLRLVEAGESEAVRRRHRDHFLHHADRWATESDYWNWWRWLGRLAADHDNFAAALEWSHAQGDDEQLLRLAAAHWPYWYWGETQGWRRWLVEAVERCSTPSAARVEALIALASLLARSGEAASRCDALFTEARAVALRLPSDQPTAQVDFYHAHFLISGGEPQTAEKMLRNALARSINPDFLGWCHWCVGSIALSADRLEEATAEFASARRLAEDVGDESLRAHVCSASALVAALRGDPEEAAALAGLAVHSAERMAGAPRVLLMALARAGQVAAMTDLARAVTPTTRLLGMLRQLGVAYWADEAFDVAGLVLAERSPEDAAAALRMSRPIGDDDGRLPALREQLVRCRAALVTALGTENRWDTAHHSTATSLDEVIDRTLAALRGSGPVVPRGGCASE